jgi:hypothetical protein
MRHYSKKVVVTFTTLYGITWQKTAFFIITTVGISNPTVHELRGTWEEEIMIY